VNDFSMVGMGVPEAHKRAMVNVNWKHTQTDKSAVSTAPSVRRQQTSLNAALRQFGIDTD
jgi:hypothetical protein